MTHNVDPRKHEGHPGWVMRVIRDKLRKQMGYMDLLIWRINQTMQGVKNAWEHRMPYWQPEWQNCKRSAFQHWLPDACRDANGWAPNITSNKKKRSDNTKRSVNCRRVGVGACQQPSSKHVAMRVQPPVSHISNRREPNRVLNFEEIGFVVSSVSGDFIRCPNELKVIWKYLQTICYTLRYSKWQKMPPLQLLTQLNQQGCHFPLPSDAWNDLTPYFCGGFIILFSSKIEWWLVHSKTHESSLVSRNRILCASLIQSYGLFHSHMKQSICLRLLSEMSTGWNRILWDAVHPKVRPGVVTWDCCRLSCTRMTGAPGPVPWPLGGTSHLSTWETK